MKKIILLFIFLSLLISSFGQKKSVSYRKNLILRDFFFTKEVLSFDNDKFIVFSRMSNYSGYNCFKFDKDFNVLKKSSIKDFIRNKRFYIEKILIIENEIFAFFTIENLNENKKNLFAVKINSNTLKFEDEIVYIGSHKIIKGNQAGGGFDFVQSENKKYVGIVMKQPYDISKKDKNKYGVNFQPGNDKISFVVIDKNLKEINATKNGLIASKKGQKMIPHKCILDNDGNFYILSIENKFTKLQINIRRDNIVDEFEHGILTIKKFGVDKNQNIFVYQGDKVFIDLDLVMDNAQNKLFLIGLVGKMARSWIGSVGIEKIEIDPYEMQEEDIVYQGFSRILMDGLLQKSVEILPNKTDLSKPDNDKKNVWKTSLTRLQSLNFVTIDNDGSIYLVLEIKDFLIHHGPLVMMKFDAESEEVYQNFVIRENINENQLDNIAGFVHDGKFIVCAQNGLFILDEDFSIIEFKYLTDYVKNNNITNKHRLWIINFTLEDQKSIVSFFKQVRKLHALRVEI